MVYAVCLSVRKLLSGEITEVSKVEDEIKKILAELSKRRSTAGQPTSEKEEEKQPISWYAVDTTCLFCDNLAPVVYLSIPLS